MNERILDELYALPGFWKSPFVTLGKKAYVQTAAAKRGVPVESVDLFDSHATIKHDMNLPIPVAVHGRAQTIVDLGTIEHVFDTKQYLDNCFHWLSVGGLLVLVTTMHGYFNHGFYQFNPVVLRDALTLNGFEIVYRRFFTENMIIPLEHVAQWCERNVKPLAFAMAANKREMLADFVVPQQTRWKKKYRK